MSTLKLGRDLNGNKTLILTDIKPFKGFSVQTNNNLPSTHEMTKETFINHIAENELNAYIKEYGTKRQKELLGW